MEAFWAALAIQTALSTSTGSTWFAPAWLLVSKAPDWVAKLQGRTIALVGILLQLSFNCIFILLCIYVYARFLVSCPPP